MHYTKNEDNTYNGWSNRETWLVNLWLTNDRSTYDYILELTDQSDAVVDLAETLKNLIAEDNPLATQANLYCDLLTTALAKVDWFEIAQSFLDD